MLERKNPTRIGVFHVPNRTSDALFGTGQPLRLRLQRLAAFNTDTGARLFQLNVEGTVVSAAAVVDGCVYFGSGMQYFTGVGGKTFYALKLK